LIFVRKERLYEEEARLSSKKEQEQGKDIGYLFDNSFQEETSGKERGEELLTARKCYRRLTFRQHGE
jgi:hypothetical protein